MRHALTQASGSAAIQDRPGCIEQHHLVEILLGSQHFDLKHFFPPGKDACGALETLPMISAEAIASPQQITAQINQEKLYRRKKKIFWGAAAGIIIMAMMAALGFLAGRLSSVQRPATNLSWRVLEVKNDGVIIATAAGSQQKLYIPKGARLPDGQRLLAVNQERQIYSTEQQDVRLRRAPVAP